MAGQERINRVSQEEEGSPNPEPTPPTAGSAAEFEVDSLLDEIDEVLEVNAESFVRGFVQKGGQ